MYLEVDEETQDGAIQLDLRGLRDPEVNADAVWGEGGRVKLLRGDVLWERLKIIHSYLSLLYHICEL